MKKSAHDHDYSTDFQSLIGKLELRVRCGDILSYRYWREFLLRLCFIIRNSYFTLTPWCSQAKIGGSFSLKF
jgi:hypothetical protein